MIAPGRNAFATARARARKGALLGPDARARLLGAPDRPALAHVLADFGLPADTLAAACWARLGDDYGRLARSVARGVDVLVELLRRHELENLKLLIRVHAHGWTAPRWQPLWRPLGALAELDLERVTAAATWEALCDAAQGTAYAPALADLRPPTVASAPAAERTLDAWMSRRLMQVAEALPAKEATTRALVRSVVLERDLTLLERAAAFGLSVDQAEAQRGTPAARGDPRTLAEVRTLRRRTCQRAFREPATRLAPSVAYLLLREEEVRGLLALEAACGARVPAELLEGLTTGGNLGVA